MPDTLELEFQGLDPLPAVEHLVREELAALTRFEPAITTCRVQVVAPHQRHRTGNRFEVHLRLGVPGGPVVISREPGDADAHVALDLTVRDAFRAARRRLQDRVRRRHGRVKSHAAMPAGRVTRIDGDHGFLATDDGRDVYFHRHAVLDDRFDALVPGDPVAFVEEAGDRGPQASTVRLRRRPSARARRTGG